jgi:hypothetical protein
MQNNVKDYKKDYLNNNGDRNKHQERLAQKLQVTEHFCRKGRIPVVQVIGICRQDNHGVEQGNQYLFFLV